MIKISKLEAARSQLDTALELLSNKGESLSIHTLTAASHGILEGLAKRSENNENNGTVSIFINS